MIHIVIKYTSNYSHQRIRYKCERARANHSHPRFGRWRGSSPKPAISAMQQQTQHVRRITFYRRWFNQILFGKPSPIRVHSPQSLVVQCLVAACCSCTSFSFIRSRTYNLTCECCKLSMWYLVLASLGQFQNGGQCIWTAASKVYPEEVGPLAALGSPWQQGA